MFQLSSKRLWNKLKLLLKLRFVLREEQEEVLLKKLTPLLGFIPGKIGYYKEALTHRSVISRKKANKHNERLEFLGDAVLSLLVAEHLYERFPDADEGELTNLRSRLTSRKILNQTAIKAGIPLLLFHKVYLRKGSEQHAIYGNALEALLGAVYLDKGMDASRDFFHRLMNRYIAKEKIIKHDANYKSQLIEWAQGEGKEVSFVLIAEEGPEHAKQFTINVVIDGEVIGVAKNSPKKKAEQDAAKATLGALSLYKPNDN